jgi:hypothetical protein
MLGVVRPARISAAAEQIRRERDANIAALAEARQHTTLEKCRAQFLVEVVEPTHAFLCYGFSSRRFDMAPGEVSSRRGMSPVTEVMRL